MPETLSGINLDLIIPAFTSAFLSQGNSYL
jgi:hypothetical protein